jgi:Deacetylases, including yeast histone deacetylase and acetoin utilization protein
VLPFKLIYSDEYYLPIGPHVFPAQKYRFVHQQLLHDGTAQLTDFVQPDFADDDDILLVHTAEYVRKLKTGTLSDIEIAQMEVPYSRELIKTVWLATGGSILAAELALQHGASINIGGGFHHAYPDHGEGFCIIHDVAVAIKALHKKGKLRRAMTVDCDVHHGNGTAAIFPPKTDTPHPMVVPGIEETLRGAIGQSHNSSAAEPQVFTISLHQQNNYPMIKPPSSIDVNLPDGTNDEQYLACLEKALTAAFRQFEPELLCYLAGADPYRDDQLGGLALTVEGLQKRDELVLRFARDHSIPVMITLAGGYARHVEDTVRIHCNTVIAARTVFGQDIPETRQTRL